MTRALDLFAGPGGWDIAARDLGLDALGVELDRDACETRGAAGLETLEGDVSELDPRDFAADMLIASPPCQTWSRAGLRDGIPAEATAVYRCLGDIADGRDTRATADVDPRSLLVVEPLRWALALQPRHIACEQVPDALDLWRRTAQLLAPHGYRSWVGILNAADYGVPQIRKRAFLLASRDDAPAPPPATHADGLSLDRQPWVTMADALDWPTDEVVGLPRRAEPHDRDTFERNGIVYRARDAFPTTRPAPTIGHQARSFTRWCFDRPAPTIVGGRRSSEGIVVGRQLPAGDGVNVGGWPGDGDGDGVRVTLAEASILQGFPADYPWRGSRSSCFQQLANAVPPPLARAALAALLPVGAAT